MKSSNISANEGLLRIHSTVSPEDILAAGGATAFGIKTEKNSNELKKALKGAPESEPFTNEEWNNLLNQLERDK